VGVVAEWRALTGPWRGDIVLVSGVVTGLGTGGRKVTGSDKGESTSKKDKGERRISGGLHKDLQHSTHDQPCPRSTGREPLRFILLISLGCTGFETICKVLTSNSNISKRMEKLFS
jgi:hypothetical protein